MGTTENTIENVLHVGANKLAEDLRIFTEGQLRSARAAVDAGCETEDLDTIRNDSYVTESRIKEAHRALRDVVAGTADLRQGVAGLIKQAIANLNETIDCTQQAHKRRCAETHETLGSAD